MASFFISLIQYLNLKRTYVFVDFKKIRTPYTFFSPSNYMLVFITFRCKYIGHILQLLTCVRLSMLRRNTYSMLFWSGLNTDILNCQVYLHIIYSHRGTDLERQLFAGNAHFRFGILSSMRPFFLNKVSCNRKIKHEEAYNYPLN